jgi:hypothetical protein
VTRSSCVVKARYVERSQYLTSERVEQC